MWRLLHCLSLLSVCSVHGNAFVQLMHSSVGLARLSGWNWSLRNTRSCFKGWACSQQPARGEKRPSTGKRDLKPGRAAPPLRLSHHILKETLLIVKNLQVSLPVLQIKCSECGGNNSLSGLWICFAFSRFSVLPWSLGISNTLLEKTDALLLVWGKEEHNKMNFRNCSFIVGKKAY